jgi:hypothetical protein
MRERTRRRNPVQTLFGGSALVELEIFTPTGVVVGNAADVPLTSDGPDLEQPFTLEAARWYPIDGGPPSQRGEATIDPDDILLIVTPEPELKIHMAWYSVALEVGPYYVSARMATHPGFDPERALARPGSTFVALSEAAIELIGGDDAGAAQRSYIHVNRYAVDKVTSSLMLGHFFPGARLVAKDSVPVG